MKHNSKNDLILSLLIVALVSCLKFGCAARQSSSLLSATDQYQLAMKKYNDKDFADAILEFQKVLFNYPGTSCVDSAQYWFAMSYYSQQDYHLAVAEFRRLITNFPASELLDDAQYMIGKSYFDSAPGNVGLDMTDNENAISELTDFLEDYPTSNRLGEGEALLSEAIEKRVTKQFKAAKQYYRMGNRASARIYLEDLIKEYPESKNTAEALFLLARVDADEHKYTDARDKLTNLISVFPQSEYVLKAEKLRQKITSKISPENQPAIESGSETIQVTKEKSE